MLKFAFRFCRFTVSKPLVSKDPQSGKPVCAVEKEAENTKITTMESRFIVSLLLQRKILVRETDTKGDAGDGNCGIWRSVKEFLNLKRVHRAIYRLVIREKGPGSNR